MIKEEILQIIDTIENIIEANKISKKNLRKKQQKIDNLLKETEFVNTEKLEVEKVQIDEEIKRLNDEQGKLKKILYRQKVSIDILEGKVDDEQ